MSERDELVALVDKHAGLFLHTVQGLTDEQARLTPTVSTLSLGGLVKHVGATIDQWLDFVENGAPEGSGPDWKNLDQDAIAAFMAGFALLPDETLAGVTGEFQGVLDRTRALIGSVDLDLVQPLPEAPWFAADESWSNRRVFIHVIAETAQHAGHADILRETIDGQKSMSG